MGLGTGRSTYSSKPKQQEKMDGKRQPKKYANIIQCEHDKSFWRRNNYTCGKVKRGSPTRIQVPRNGQDDQNDEYTTQSTVHEAIWVNIHYKRLYLVEEAPICQGQLLLDFGYNAATCIAADILDGRYIYPEEFDQATKELAH